MELRPVDRQQIPADDRGKPDEDDYRFARVHVNEALLDGFVLLRLAQLLNSDVYYIGLLRQKRHSRRAKKQAPRGGRTAVALSESKQHLVESEMSGSKRSPVDLECGQPSCSSSQQSNLSEAIDGEPSQRRLGSPARYDGGEPAEPKGTRRHLLDELAGTNPCRRLFESKPWLSDLARMICIGLSLVAIMISVDKTISTILLCLISRPDIKARPGNIGIAYETSDITMSWLVLILLNISSMYILFSTIFNGHLLWNLLDQRLFLVSRSFQYKTMLSMFVFIYLEYIINISFVNNLFGWSFETNDNDVASEGPGGARWHKAASGGDSGGLRASNTNEAAGGRSSASNLQGNIVASYSVLSNIKTFVTEKDEANPLLDVLLTIFQFARGIIRMSPYITINYVTICLSEHIKTIRNQNLLTESLKRKQKLRMVVKSRRKEQRANQQKGQAAQSSGSPRRPTASPTGGGNVSAGQNVDSTRKKRVIFVTEASAAAGDGLAPSSPSPVHSETGTALRPSSRASLSVSPNLSLTIDASRTPSPSSVVSQTTSSMSSQDKQPPGDAADKNRRHQAKRLAYLDRIKDFNELEADVTNLYIFTGRLNRLMARQGLAFFFVVHNLVITTTLIVPEAISGGSFMVQLVRVLVVLIGIVPFVAGQSLDGQLEQLSKQIDRIIIKQQFISRKRDNLVRIRELLYDIRVNCGGMLDFNIETGIKYLVVAFATAFFIEQEGKLARDPPLAGGDWDVNQRRRHRRRREISSR